MTSLLEKVQRTQSDEIGDFVGIAIDGGGMKGAIVAKGLEQLEKTVGHSPLRDWPKLKVVAGTSTGSLIASAIAAGLTAAEIFELYRGASQQAFSQLSEIRPFGRPTNPVIRAALRQISRRVQSDLLDYILYPARYSFDPLRAILRQTLAAHPSPNDDPTMGELGDHLRATLGPDALTLVIAATGVVEQRTFLFKTTATESPEQKQIKLVDAMLASSSIPTYFPPVALRVLPGDEPTYCVDGGVGSFGNPAYIAAYELCDTWNPDPARRYPPERTTVFSFGTGLAPQGSHVRHRGPIPSWWALDWFSPILDIFTASAIRHQSRTVLSSYEGIDFRRFQLQLTESVSADETDIINKPWFEGVCQELRDRIDQNLHALKDPAYDPEGIQQMLD